MLDMKMEELTQFAERNSRLVLSKDADHMRYLTPQGQVVFAELYKDGNILRIVAS